uniref:Large ribosomal subunit protein uL23c n=1 Tax=Cyanidium caldarium TaxID=2771 RepID=RK23_CYACA|nr:ribosomal protein L23 [Cyanidium caldarium]Q9TLT4.1 RecName: Full=Large ribosomal subunit protein uL23c; AltName: Full=50S ribosomal protein L23, chloroplastic [Cyanidium caldarium]AAF12909.1 unknown [Cyanidium caldarium]WDB00310.1 ribosomal protein L23 [Cyanidium caldarium]
MAKIISSELPDLILSSVITDKTIKLLETKNYTFLAPKEVSKIAFKRAIEDMFKVKVNSINSLNLPNKKKRVGRYKTGSLPLYKKMIVKLDSKDTIDLFLDR